MDAEAKRRALEGERDEGVQLHREEEVDGVDSSIADEKVVRRRGVDDHVERRRANRGLVTIEREESEERGGGGEKRGQVLVGHIDPHVGKREIEKQHASIP